MHKDCQSKAISSHSISETISLKTISDNRKLLTPKSSRKYPDKKFSIGEMEITQASTFKGFCKTHDNDIFKGLDYHSTKSVNDLISQAYRTICYIVFTDDTYLIAQRESLALAQQDLKDNNILENAVTKNNKTITRLLNIKNHIEIVLEEYPKKEIKVAENITEFTTEQIHILFKQLKYQIPVAINTKITYTINKEFDLFEFDLFVTCMPYENCTDIMIMFEKNNLKYFKEMLFTIFNNDIDLLNFIEKLMFMTDQWWIKPSIYNNFSEQKKGIFLEDSYNYAGITETEILSIFDDIRLRLITNTPRFDAEVYKINNLPNRDSFESRKKNTMNKITTSLLHIPHNN